MIVRDFDVAKDYEVLGDWWKRQEWPVIPKEMLGTKGLVVEKDNQQLAATWVFATGCTLYVMEWTVGNPDVSWEVRSEAISLVTKSACDWAKEDGASFIVTFTKSKRFIDKLENCGFIKSETDMTHLIRSL